MKQQAIQHVALDVHQPTLVVSVRDEQGSIVMRATLATEASSCEALGHGCISRSRKGQAQWLHDVLTKHAERVIVCNASVTGVTAVSVRQWWLRNSSAAIADPRRLRHAGPTASLTPRTSGDATGIIAAWKTTRDFITT
jgi:hypothetical protein